MAARDLCCCTSGYFDDSFTEVMNRLHLKEEVVTEEECKDIYRKHLRPKSAIQASLLSLVICTKSVEQSTVATKILEGYRTVLTELTLRYLSVLSELYENELITSDDVPEMKRMGGNLMARLVSIQYGKKADIIPKTEEIIRRHDFTEESKILTALGDISQEGLMSKEEVQQVPKCWEGSQLETALNSICAISCTKEPSVMTRIADILLKSGFTDQKHVMLLRALGDIRKEGLLSKEEVRQVPKCWEGYPLETVLNSIGKNSCTKEPSVMTRIADILLKSGFTDRKNAMLLRALGDISQEGLMSKEEVGEIRKKWERSFWWTALNHACAISFRKESSVMTRIADILHVCGLSGEEEVMLLKVVSKMPEKNLLANKLFVGKETKGTWEQFVTIVVHQCPRPLEISLETAKVFEEHDMVKEAKCVRAGSKAIHQVFGGKSNTTVDVSTNIAAMKVVSGVLGVLLLHDDRYSLVAETTEDKLIVKFQTVSELCSTVLPKKMKDTEWNVVRTGNPVHFHITDGLMAVGVSPELGEKTGKLVTFYWEGRLSKEECDRVFFSKLWRDELERLTRVQLPFGPRIKGSSRRARSHAIARQHPGPTLDFRRARSHLISSRYQEEKSTFPIIYGSTLTSGYVSMASSIDDLPQLSEIETDLLTPIEILKQKDQPSHLGPTDPTPSSGGNSDPPRRDPGPDYDHEFHLLEQCWIPFGIQTLRITQNGGEFLLEPGTPERSVVGNRAFCMEVPATAISRDSLEMRYGIILDGPFALPSGYRLASPVVYVWFDHSKVTKSLKLHIPHWIATDHGHLEEDVSFVISPHVLPEGEQMYTFTAMEPECTSLHDTFGTVELSGQCSLLGLAMGEEIPSCYLATPWEKEDGNKKYLKVAIVYCIPFWLEVLSKYWESWNYCGDDDTCPVFEVNEDKVTGKLRKHSGNGWEAGLNQAAIKKMGVSYHLHKTEEKMEFAVKRGFYPPSFLVKIIQSCSPGCITAPAAVYLDVSGTTLGDMCFSVEVQEMVLEKVSTPKYAGKMSLHTSGLDDSHTPQSLEFHNKIPSDVGLQGVLNKSPVWYSLAISLGVPIEQVEAWESKSLGGLLALRYWRDGKSGDLFPPTWGFLLEKFTVYQGSTVVDALEKEVQSNPTWSSM